MWVTTFVEAAKGTQVLDIGWARNIHSEPLNDQDGAIRQHLKQDMHQQRVIAECLLCVKENLHTMRPTRPDKKHSSVFGAAAPKEYFSRTRIGRLSLRRIKGRNLGWQALLFPPS